MNLTRIFGVALATAGLAITSGVYAQAPGAGYPSRPVRFVVPYAPGGLPDTVARLLARSLAERWGQSVTVDNRPGANGVVSAQFMMNAAADGYTLLVTDNSMFVINPALYTRLPYDARKDFIPISLAARAPIYFALHPSVAANNLAEFIALIKSKPGALSYGSSGIGSTHHLTMEALKAALNLDIVHVPFKGTGQSVPALIGGQVPVALSALPSLVGFVKSNQVKLVASNAPRRSSQAPNVPTIAETLIPGFDFAPTIGVFATSGVPMEIVHKVSADIAQLVKSPAVIESMNALGIDPVGGSSEEYVAALREDTERYARAVKSSGIKPE